MSRLLLLLLLSALLAQELSSFRVRHASPPLATKEALPPAEWVPPLKSNESFEDMPKFDVFSNETLPPADEIAIVDEMYTWGAPCVSSGPMLNPRSEDGCWPGMRMVNSDLEPWWDAIDIVPVIFRLFGFTHPTMKVAMLSQDLQYEIHPCTALPGFVPPNVAIWLHMPMEYVRRWPVQTWNESIANLSGLIIRPSYTYDPEMVQERINPYGWKIVGTAHVHDKVSHLLQDPNTLDCIITFQGSVLVMDWIENLQFTDAPFCGLPSKVHQGFRTQTRWMTQSEMWQTNIRAKLGFCKTVTAGGQSLGGGMAALFSACVAQAPTEGLPWEYDYKYLWWKKGVPRRLEPIGASVR